MGRTYCALLILMAAVVVAACGRDSVTTDPSLVVYRGNGGEPGSLDPVLAEDVHAFNILADLYEGLVATSTDGSLVPGAAESWITSEDGRTLTFTLRRQARWSNGDPVRAADFVKTFHRVADPATASTYSFLLEPLHRVVAPDDLTLQIELLEPAPHLLAILAMPIAFPTPPAALGSGTFVGNGAYVLVSHEVGGSIRLQRSSTYWDAGSVNIEQVVYLPIVDPQSEFNMYRSGELDITYTIPAGQVQNLRRDMPAHLRISPSLALYYLAFDLSEPPFDDVTLRQALSMAIDRDQLVSLIGRGEQAAFGIVPDGVARYEGARFAWQSLSRDDRQQRALELYRDAGYSKDAPLKFKLTYDTGDIHEKVALIVSSMWREVLGAEVVLEKMEWKYFLETRDKRDDWQVMRFSWFGDYNHASTFTNIFRSGDPQNLPRYKNPEYDQLLVEASRTTDDIIRANLVQKAERLLLEDHPIAPLYFFVSKHLVNPRITGFERNALDRHPSKYLALGEKKTDID